MQASSVLTEHLLTRPPIDWDLDAPALSRRALARGPADLWLNHAAAVASMLDLAKLSDPGQKHR
ncbi:MAG TPA: hypothetical protein DDZ81_21695 [Acetobacteraceae bacterium]|jgi:hypothetical protein|nr:hypothetical protein [Acetobacteraceae bacterium]